MVGHHQAIGGDERSRPAAIETHRRFLQMLEPRGSGLEMVFVLQNLEWGIVERHIPSSARE